MKVIFMGKSGVGKTSLINKIFGLEWKTDPVVECTKTLHGAWIINDKKQFGETNEHILVVDTPGISASEENDIYYKQAYEIAVQDTNCIVWVVQGNTRADLQDQEMIEEFIMPLMKKKPKIKFVVCINRVDLIGANYEMDWCYESNLPSDNMLRLINERKAKFQSVLDEIDFTLPLSNFVACSAIKNYGTENLLKTIFD